AVGWLWYLGTLVPVIGLVQVGEQTMADRYFYIPSIGLFVIVAWGLGELVLRRPAARIIAAVALAVTLAAYVGICRYQLQFWKDQESLLQRGLAVEPNNWTLLNNLGVWRWEHGKKDEAEKHWRTAVTIRPGAADAHSNLGYCLAEQNKLEEAALHLQLAIQYKPILAEAHNNLGLVRLKQRRLLQSKNEATPEMVENLSAEAMQHFRDALKYRPAELNARDNLATTLMELAQASKGEQQRAQFDEAESQLREILRLKPSQFTAWIHLSNLRQEQGRPAEALDVARQAVGRFPDSLPLQDFLVQLLWEQSQRAQAQGATAEARQLAGEARQHLWQCLRLSDDRLGMARRWATMFIDRKKPDQALIVLNFVAWTLATSPDDALRNGAQAVTAARDAVQLSGGRDPSVLDTLAAALAEAGQFSEAVQTAGQAVQQAKSQGKAELAAKIQNRLNRYSANAPFRDSQ
ncbi:MAG: tetratricopeptide repeat protein, partial [Thermoguttaceae bacterium]